MSERILHDCSIHVAIPSVGASEFLVPLVRAALLDADVTRVTVYENRGGLPWPSAGQQLVHACLGDDPRLHYRPCHGTSLYGVWNRALDDTAALEGDRPVCVLLNDDVVVSRGALSGVARELWARPNAAIVGLDYDARRPDVVTGEVRCRPVEGTYRAGGVGGFAFAVDAAKGVRVDEQFEWWGGDDDLVLSALTLGYGVFVAEGLPVRHPHAETSAIHFPELAAAKDRDRLRLRSKWGQSW